jgi:hypothetical protein
MTAIVPRRRPPHSGDLLEQAAVLYNAFDAARSSRALGKALTSGRRLTPSRPLPNTGASAPSG